MLILASASDKLQINTSGACQLDTHVSWMDNVVGAVNPGRTNTANITAAGTTDICAGPAAGNFRNIKTVHIRNRGGPVGLILRHTDGTTVVELYRVNLATDQTLSYIDETGFFSSQPPRPLGGSFIHGLMGATQASRTKVDFSYFEGTLRSPADGSLLFVQNVSFTIDIAVQGANGRDQAAALGDVGIHFYTIAGSAVATAGIASQTPPSSGGPTLPAGYTHWAYVTTVRKDSGLICLAHFEGSKVQFDPQVIMLSGGNVSNAAAAPLTPISFGQFVPLIGTNILLEAEATLALLNAGGGAVAAELMLGPSAGGFVSRRIRVDVPDIPGAATPYVNTNSASPTIPNINVTYYYAWHPLVNGGNIHSYSANIWAAGYEVPNGD